MKNRELESRNVGINKTTATTISGNIVEATRTIAKILEIIMLGKSNENTSTFSHNTH